MAGEVQHLVGEAPLVVIPGDQLDEVLVQGDAGLGVEADPTGLTAALGSCAGAPQRTGSSEDWSLHRMPPKTCVMHVFFALSCSALTIVHDAPLEDQHVPGGGENFAVRAGMHILSGILDNRPALLADMNKRHKRSSLGVLPKTIVLQAPYPAADHFVFSIKYAWIASASSSLPLSLASIASLPK